MSKDHSEPAFPSNSHEYGPVLGISLRDYFAAKAMQGMLAAPHHPASDQFMLARDAYCLADAMLEERAK